MNEGLEALKYIKRDYTQFMSMYDKEQLDIIEKELKEGKMWKEQYEILKKELADLHESTLRTNFENAKEHQALDIIKNKCEIELDKEYGTHYLNIVCDYGYDMSAVCIKVSKEEYDLLKEVML